jgi:tRNA threonylcarbamoyladenosine biosynthesis protein TsaB
VKILGISGSTDLLGVALSDDGAVLAEYFVVEKKAQAENITVFLDKIVKESGIELGEVEGIAVTRGPGSYGGIRGGLAAAKSLAQVLSVPVVGISTLEAIAFNLIGAEGAVFSVLDACRSDYNAALFASSGKKLTRLTDDIVLHEKRLKEFLSSVTGVIHINGATERFYPEFVSENPDSKIIQADAAFSLPKPSNVALIGEMLIREGKTVDPMKLVPYYSHQPNLREFQK